MFKKTQPPASGSWVNNIVRRATISRTDNASGGSWLQRSSLAKIGVIASIIAILLILLVTFVVLGSASGTNGRKNVPAGVAANNPTATLAFTPTSPSSTPTVSTPIATSAPTTAPTAEVVTKPTAAPAPKPTAAPAPKPTSVPAPRPTQAPQPTATPEPDPDPTSFTITVQGATYAFTGTVGQTDAQLDPGTSDISTPDIEVNYNQSTKPGPKGALSWSSNIISGDSSGNWLHISQSSGKMDYPSSLTIKLGASILSNMKANITYTKEIQLNPNTAGGNHVTVKLTLNPAPNAAPNPTSTTTSNMIGPSSRFAEASSTRVLLMELIARPVQKNRGRLA